MEIKIINDIAMIKSNEIIIKDVQSAIDFIMTIKYETNCNKIALNKEAVIEDFFILSKGLAGEILQKFINYQIKFAIYGDYSKYTSKPLKDFIYESNKGKDIFFIENEEEAIRKLSKMKKIYIILTHTGTNLSKLIKSYTKDEFSHVSIALDPELKQMYSFGRLNPYNPFWAGFVHEEINNGTFKRFYMTKTRIYSLEITEKQYETIKNKIQEIEKEKEQYTFNILGLFAAGFHKKIAMKKSFYCAEFVKHVMDQAEIKTELPEVAKPEDFKKIKNLKEIYSGFLRKYKYDNLTEM